MKNKAKYVLSLHDSAHLTRIWSLKLRWWVAIPALLLSLALLIGAAVAIIIYTPLKQTLPGYMPPKERKTTIDDLMKVDSMQHLYEINQAYLDNLLTVLDTERSGGDSLKWAALTVKQAGDSLMGTSTEEKKFRAMMDERERYNLSILAPMAAEGMMFQEPAPGYTFAHGSEKSMMAKILVPRAESLRNLADGYVLDVYFTPGESYVAIIQHSNGFISRWSHLGTPMVRKGENVVGGQALASTPASGGYDASYTLLEMWRNGTPLVPYNILRPEHAQHEKVEPLSDLKKD